ncbi:hypothetical protein V5799_000786 [Amblyomma americanum]|uniref:Uncharacterized protein n=1 Tax=Amblyomma americanum TaxID=6943 RepID=A0AAQ4D225_AMBAM
MGCKTDVEKKKIIISHLYACKILQQLCRLLSLHSHEVYRRTVLKFHGVPHQLHCALMSIETSDEDDGRQKSDATYSLSTYSSLRWLY